MKRLRALVALFVLALPAAPRAASPNPDIIARLQQLLTQAQSGDMTGFAWVATFGTTGNLSYNWLGDDSNGVLGKGMFALFAHYNGFYSQQELAAAQSGGFTQGLTAASALASQLSTQILALPVPAAH